MRFVECGPAAACRAALTQMPAHGEQKDITLGTAGALSSDDFALPFLRRRYSSDSPMWRSSNTAIGAERAGVWRLLQPSRNGMVAKFRSREL